MGIERKCEVCDRRVERLERVIAESHLIHAVIVTDGGIPDRIRLASVCGACASIGDGRDAEPRIERGERPEIFRVAYRMVCDVCELEARAEASFRMAHKYENVPEAPKREEFRTQDAYAHAFMIDLMCGDAEKRGHNRKVEKFEREAIHDPLRYDLSRRGCPHALT